MWDHFEMLRSIRGAWRLLTGPRFDRRVVLKAIRMTPRVASSLERIGYASTREWLETLGTPDFGSPVTRETLRKADTAIRALPWSMRCLERSLVIWWIAGDEAVIKLGVAPTEDGAGHRFHAWVERDSVILNDSPAIVQVFLPLVGHSVESADPQLFD